MKDLSNDAVVHIKKDGIEYIQFRKLLEYPEVKHCYTLKTNGLNFKLSEDNKETLVDSDERICKALLINKESIVRPIQTHTNVVECAENNTQRFENTDGVITNKKGIVLYTLSADCTNLLFYDPVKKVIADVHSGWKGTLQKIGAKAVEKMIKQYNSNPSDIICCMCPHIRKCHFEVEEDVKSLFEKEFEQLGKEKIIKKGKILNGVQKYFIDTTLINKLMLKEVGLMENNIIDSGICTVCESENLHSYRMDKENAGRNAAIISLQ